MSDKRKKQQSYYQKNKKKFKHFNLEPGQKGFLCSCNNREKDCIREAYNILNKYADKLYGAEIKPNVNVETNEEKKDSDIEDELQNELSELKSKKVDSKSRRFQVVESGAKNMIFVRTTVDDTVKIAYDIVSDVYGTNTQQTRFLIRLIPIEATCKAHIDNIKTAIKPLIERHFTDGPKLFSIMYNHRNNNNLDKDSVIKAVADLVGETRSDHTVNLKSADISIVIEVIKNVALLAVVPDFLKFKKFNLIVNNTCSESNKLE